MGIDEFKIRTLRLCVFQNVFICTNSTINKKKYGSYGI